MHDYSLLYKALLSNKMALPAKVLRFFKEEYYNFVRSSTPSKHIMVGSINDPRVRDDQLVMALGTFSEFGEVGLRGISLDDWMKNIVTKHLVYDTDQLLSSAFPILNKNYAYKLPVNKYLSEATMHFETCKKQARQHHFEEIVSNSIKRSRNSIKFPERSVKAIMANENMPFSKRLYLIAHLREDEIDISDLENLLIQTFKDEPNIYGQSKEIKTHLNRVIRLYDYLEYHAQWE